VAGSSNAPVTHYAPLFGIEQALTRRTMAGDVCGPDECVDLTTAIRMHTIHGAFASFDEGFKGSLEVGKVADLVVLAEDVSRVPIEHIRDVGMAMTVVGGGMLQGIVPPQTSSRLTLLVKSVNHPYWGILLPPHALSVCPKLMSFPCEEMSYDLTPAHRLLAQDVDTTVTGETATLRGGRRAPSPLPRAWRPRGSPDHPRCGSRCGACRPG
jgi:hypothetical protein